jgi:hypothetical protein
VTWKNRDRYLFLIPCTERSGEGQISICPDCAPSSSFEAFDVHEGKRVSDFKTDTFFRRGLKTRKREAYDKMISNLLM